MEQFDNFITIVCALLVMSLLANFISILAYTLNGSKDIFTTSFRLYTIQAKFLLINTLTTFFLALSLMISNEVFDKKVRREIQLSLNAFHAQTSEIYINNSLIVDSQSIIDVLGDIGQSHYHSSFPKDTINVLIKNRNGSCRVRLMRDSELKDEYWVFYDRYRKSKNNDIGKIHSKALYAY